MDWELLSQQACAMLCGMKLMWRLQAAVLLQGLLARRPEQRLTVSKALHIMASLGNGD